MASAYGHKLKPFRAMHTQLAAKGERMTNATSTITTTIDRGQMLNIDVPNLGPDDVIVPGTVRVAFNLALTGGSGTGADANRTVVNNFGCAIISRHVVKVNGRVLYDLDDADIYLCYKNLWFMTNKQRKQLLHGSANTGKIKIGAIKS